MSLSPTYPWLIRPSVEADLPAITAIYGQAVASGTGSFELAPPNLAEMAQRRAELLAKGLPWLVAVSGGGSDGLVGGYAYANHFRPRLGFRYCLEDSIYLADEAQNQGLGTLLLAELIARCEALGARQMVAVIGDSANTASIRLHQRLGFAHAGQFNSAGRKFERWLDVVFMQRPLGLGDSRPPEAC